MTALPARVVAAVQRQLGKLVAEQRPGAPETAPGAELAALGIHVRDPSATAAPDSESVPMDLSMSQSASQMSQSAGTDNSNEIIVDMDGPQGTPYEGGRFVLKLILPQSFPSEPFRAVFTTQVFHPNVGQNGDVCVNALKKDWDSSAWSLAHILRVIRCLLIVPFPDSALNAEAAKTFTDCYEEFCETAAMYTRVHARPTAQMVSANYAASSSSSASASGNASANHRVSAAAPMRPVTQYVQAAAPLQQMQHQQDGNTARESRERDRKDDAESEKGDRSPKSPRRGLSKPGLLGSQVSSMREVTAGDRENQNFAGIGNGATGGATFGVQPQNKPPLQRHDTGGSTTSVKKKNRVLKRL